MYLVLCFRGVFFISNMLLFAYNQVSVRPCLPLLGGRQGQAGVESSTQQRWVPIKTRRWRGSFAGKYFSTLKSERVNNVQKYIVQSNAVCSAG